MCQESTVPTTEFVSLEGYQQDGSWVIAVRGELDLSGCQSVREGFAKAAAASCDRVVLDAGGVTFFDCGGLRALEAAITAWRGEVWLRSPSPPVRSMAEVFGLGPSGWRGDTSGDDVRLT